MLGRNLFAFSISLAIVATLMIGWNMAHSQQPAPKTAQPATPKTLKPAGKVLRHIVMYKFKDDQSPAQIQEVIDAFASLPKKIDTIVGFEHGTNVSPEGKSDGFTHCFVVTFAKEADRDGYLKHPAHDDYVKVVKDRREKVVVFDYWADR